MADLQDLYQQVIIDHGKNPRNFGECPDCNLQQEGNNPLCGDNLTVYVKAQDGVVDDIKFEGVGCAISMASASLMSEAIKGKPVSGIQPLFESFRALVMGEADVESSQDLGKLTVLGGVSAYPMRVKCATLAWHTLLGAFNAENKVVSSE